MLVFCITWLPCIVWNLHQAATMIRIPQTAEYIIMWMGVSNSSLNFFIFLTMNCQFRSGFIMLIKCKTPAQIRRDTLYAIPVSHTCSNSNSSDNYVTSNETSSSNVNYVSCHLSINSISDLEVRSTRSALAHFHYTCGLDCKYRVLVSVVCLSVCV